MGSDESGAALSEESRYGPESLATLLGSRRGAIDASLPPIVFGVAWWLADRSIPIGVAAAIGVGVVLALWRIARNAKPLSVLIGQFGVCIAGAIALYTGRAEDFFLIQVLSNIASLLAWAFSILIRWPLLGLIVGGVLQQRTSWRKDADLTRAYCQASWIWVCQYAIRVTVFVPLWWAGWTEALTVARAALSWPLVAACLGTSWWVLRKALPAAHPGIRHPVPETPAKEPE